MVETIAPTLPEISARGPWWGDLGSVKGSEELHCSYKSQAAETRAPLNDPQTSPLAENVFTLKSAVSIYAQYCYMSM